MGWGAVPPQAPSLLAPLRLLHPLPRADPWSSGDHSPHCLYTQGINNTSRPRCPQFLTRPKPLIQDPFIKPSKVANSSRPSSSCPHPRSFQSPQMAPLSNPHVTCRSAPATSQAPRPMASTQLPLMSSPRLTCRHWLSSSRLLAASCSPVPPDAQQRGPREPPPVDAPPTCALICRWPQG